MTLQEILEELMGQENADQIIISDNSTDWSLDGLYEDLASNDFCDRTNFDGEPVQSRFYFDGEAIIATGEDGYLESEAAYVVSTANKKAP